MPLNVNDLHVQITADTAGLVRGQRQVNQFVNKTEGSFKRLSGALRGFLPALSVGVAVEGLRRAALLADEFQVLENRVRTATRSTGDFAKVNQELFAISQRTGSALRGNVALFQSFSRSAKDVGITNDEVLQLTETFGQLGVIGGSTQVELDNGLRQLGQAISGGSLRAEEFNSIFENIPEVGNALAKELGVGVGELRRMSAAGELTSKVLTDAFLRIGPEVQAQFGELPATLGQATTRLSNAWGKFILQLDQAFGGTSSLAALISRIADALGGDFSVPLSVIKGAFQVIGEIVSALWDVLVGIGKVLLIVPRTMFKIQGGTTAWKDTFEIIIGVIKIISNVINSLIGVIERVSTAIFDFLFEPFVRLSAEIRELFLEVGSFILNFFLDIAEKAAGILQGIPLLSGVGDGLQGSIDNIRAEIAAIQERRAVINDDREMSNAADEEDKVKEETKVAEEETNLIARLAATEGFLAKSAALKKQFANKEFSDQANAFGKQLSQAAQHNKAAFQLNKAANLSNAIIDGYSSIVSSFKFGSEIGGPIVGGIFAAIAAVATAAQISAIRGESYSGGRASGGSVSGGRMYRVNENGPELLSTGGKDYLMMGAQGGSVTSNRNLRGGGVDKRPINVIVNNTGPPITAVASQSETAEQTLINLAIEGAERRVATGIRSGNSPVAVALQGTYGVNRAAGAR